MNPRLAHLLVCLYPRWWRERYGTEFEALLQAGRGGLRPSANVVWSAVYEHVFPTPGLVMNEHSIGTLTRKPSAFLPITMSLTALAVVLVHIAIFGTAREPDDGWTDASAGIFRHQVAAAGSTADAGGAGTAGRSGACFHGAGLLLASVKMRLGVCLGVLAIQLFTSQKTAAEFAESSAASLPFRVVRAGGPHDSRRDAGGTLQINTAGAERRSRHRLCR
jgi:hypothetical protein